MIRAILTPLLCSILILFMPPFEQGMLLFPLIFGFAVSVVNFKKIKINPFVGIFSCIGISYLIYFASIYLTIGVGIVYRFIEEKLGFEYANLTTALIIFTSGIISAMIMYIIYSFIFKKQNRKKGVLIILSIGFLIPFVVWLFSNNSNYIDNFDLALYQMAWLLIMSFGFGMAINQSEINTWIKKILK